MKNREVSGSGEEGAVRLPPELLARAEALLPYLRDDPRLRKLGRASRASVVRLAMLLGLELMEEHYAPRWRVVIAPSADGRRWSWVVYRGNDEVERRGGQPFASAPQSIARVLTSNGVSEESARRILNDAEMSPRT